MKKINVIDLDNTLINFDSFRSYVFVFLKKGNLSVFNFLLQRKMKIISKNEFKKRVTNHCRKTNNYENWIKQFSVHILKNLDKELLLRIESISDENTINILSSASITDYVDLVAYKLGWHSIATSVFIDSINHNYGKQKLKNLLEKYPREKYIYNFSISDSVTDLEMLKHFNKYELLR